MPIYEYRRPDGTTFELQQSFSDDALTVDPGTGVPVQRVLHPPALHFKGNGFYNTDYGTRNRERENAANAASSAKDSAAKDSAAKDSSGKDSAAKDSSGKDSSGKDSSGKDSGAGNSSSAGSARADREGSSSEGKGKRETGSKTAAGSNGRKPVASRR